MQRIVRLCPKQDVDRGDPSDLIIHRGSVTWFYQKENREITRLQYVSELHREKIVVCQARWEALDPLAPVRHKPGWLELGNRACVFNCEGDQLLGQKWRVVVDLVLYGTLGSRMGGVLGRDVLVLRFLFTCCQILVKKNGSVTKAH